MMTKILPLIISLLLFFLSCTDNPIDNQSDNTFSVEINVVDSSGNPIPNIRVSIWNKINNVSTLNKMDLNNNIRASTVFRYTVVQQCFVNLIISDLNNELIQEMVSGQYDAGIYEVIWPTSLSNGVYKCILTISSDSLQNTVLFKDSIYASLISPDPFISLIGQTNNEGSIKVLDKLLFPHLFNLPLLPITLEVGPEIVGYFKYSDSVVIALSNESFSNTTTFDRLIIDGPNKFIFTLDNIFFQFEKDLRTLNSQPHSIQKSTDRFFSIDTVALTSFTGISSNQDVVLNWETSTELNNQGFEIQRTVSGYQTWDSIGFVQGQGTTNEPHSYSFRDQNLFSGSYKYRLKQIDFDGSFSFSEEIEVDVVTSLAWKLYQNYPNPFN